MPDISLEGAFQPSSGPGDFPLKPAYSRSRSGSRPNSRSQTPVRETKTVTPLIQYGDIEIDLKHAMGQYYDVVCEALENGSKDGKV